MDYTPHPLPLLFDVSAIINISYYRLASNYAFAGERHAFWEFICVDRGSIAVTADSKKFLLKAGELAFHQPEEFHAFQAVGASDVIVVSFLCQSGAMDRFREAVLPLHREEKQCLQALVQEASACYRNFENDPPRIDLQKKADAPAGCEQLIKNGLEQLLILLCRRGDEHIGLAQRVIPTNQAHRRLLLAQQLRDYLAAHYAEKLSLASLAAALGVSASTLKLLFREQLRASMVQYLTALRIGEARRLIRQDELNFSQIAERVGFESLSYFSSLFKKQTGMSPSEYAKSLKG